MTVPDQGFLNLSGLSRHGAVQARCRKQAIQTANVLPSLDPLGTISKLHRRLGRI